MYAYSSWSLTAPLAVLANCRLPVRRHRQQTMHHHNTKAALCESWQTLDLLSHSDAVDLGQIGAVVHGTALHPMQPPSQLSRRIVQCRCVDDSKRLPSRDMPSSAVRSTSKSNRSCTRRQPRRCIVRGLPEVPACPVSHLSSHGSRNFGRRFVKLKAPTSRSGSITGSATWYTAVSCAFVTRRL